MAFAVGLSPLRRLLLITKELLENLSFFLMSSGLLEHRGLPINTEALLACGENSIPGDLNARHLMSPCIPWDTKAPQTAALKFFPLWQERRLAKRNKEKFNEQFAAGVSPFIANGLLRARCETRIFVGDCPQHPFAVFLLTLRCALLAQATSGGEDA
jgi:hypothetical protein